MRTVVECVAWLCVIQAIEQPRRQLAARRVVRDFLEANEQDPATLDELRNALNDAHLDGPVGEMVRSEVEIFEREREALDLRWSD